MVGRTRARGFGKVRNKKATGAILTFQCETCQRGELRWPCKVDVVWASYTQNPHLMEKGWEDRVLKDGRCTILDVEGTSHTIVLARDLRQSAETTLSESSRTAQALVRWRSDTFGSTSMLEILSKADGISFKLEDQDHWLDQDKTTLILQVGRSVDVIDTNGKTYTITRTDPLAENKAEAFRQWKVFLTTISLRLMGVDAVQQFQLAADPLWTLYDATPQPQPVVGSQTPLDEFDWNYDADPSQDLEDHLAKLGN